MTILEDIRASLVDRLVNAVIDRMKENPNFNFITDEIERAEQWLSNGNFNALTRRAFDTFLEGLKQEAPVFLDTTFIQRDDVQATLMAYIMLKEPDENATVNALKAAYDTYSVPENVRPLLPKYLRQLRLTLVQNKKFGALITLRSVEETKQAVAHLEAGIIQRLDAMDTTMQSGFQDVKTEIQTGVATILEEIKREPESPVYSGYGAMLYTNAKAVKRPSNQFTKLIGRDEIRDSLLARLANGEQVLLYGFSGQGKTTLATEVVKTWLSQDRGDVLWLQAGKDDIPALTEALGRGFGQEEVHQIAQRESDDAKLRALYDLLVQKRVKLLVLDDCWNEGARRRLLEKGIPEEIPVLVTARQQHSMSKRVFLPELKLNDALALLRLHAGDMAADEPAARDLCTALYGLSFALEIAGINMAIQTWSANEMTRRIAAERLTLQLSGSEAGRENLAALIAASRAAISDEAQKVFDAWGAFFAPRITPQLMEDYFDNQVNTDTALNELRKHGLATRTPEAHNGENRPIHIAYYDLHDLAQEYAARRVTSDDRLRALAACRAYTMRYAQPALENFAALRPLLDELINAADYAFQHQHYNDVERFAWDLYAKSGILDYGGYSTHAIRLLYWATQAAHAQGNRLDENAHLGHLGNAYAALGQYERAIEAYKKALVIAREIRDKQGEGNALGSIGIVYRNLGQYESAMEYLQQALEISLTIKDKRGEGITLSNMGNTYANLGKYESAMEYHQQALEISLAIGDKRGEGIALGNLGNVYRYLEQYERAIETCEKALVIRREIGYKRGEGDDLNNLGAAYWDLQAFDKALDYYQQARAIYAELGLAHMVERVDKRIARLQAKLRGEDTPSDDD